MKLFKKGWAKANSLPIQTTPNQEGPKPEPPSRKGLSDQQLQHMLDLYGKVSPSQFPHIQSVKKDYLQETSKRRHDRSMADKYYNDGIKAGLQHASHTTLLRDRRASDQRLRDQTSLRAKRLYRSSENLSHFFKNRHTQLTRLFNTVRSNPLRHNMRLVPNQYKGCGRLDRDFKAVSQPTKAYHRLHQTFQRANLSKPFIPLTNSHSKDMGRSM